ncbi:hypothetical protein [Tranquillimonas rosea]|uniref:hypothetical protein n=1 Tax=Tranquillimonas rosea TaxID=641238 RepID=UPI0015A62C6A|nr:hypothetical protein [Tranquillimonas rosea]
MVNDWLLHVLADLRTFAEKNDFRALAQQLDDTALVAACEIATKEGQGSIGAGTSAGEIGCLHRAGAGRRLS